MGGGDLDGVGAGQQSQARPVGFAGGPGRAADLDLVDGGAADGEPAGAAGQDPVRPAQAVAGDGV